MANKSAEETLKKYLPEATVSACIHLLNQHRLLLTIKKSRSTKLGDFRPAHGNTPARISVNGDLNKYSFLITLIHEIAHGVCWTKYKSMVKPHGGEWKSIYSEMLSQFIGQNIFPNDLEKIVITHIHRPKASSCSDMNLLKALKKYDDSETLFLEDLPFDAQFELSSGRIFQKKEQKRKRFYCIELKTQRAYLVNPLAEVKLLE